VRVHGLPELQAPVHAIDRMGGSSALAKHCFAVSDNELDLGPHGKSQFVTDLDGHGDLPLGRDATLHG
jgi:hypothetical protein